MKTVLRGLTGLAGALALLVAVRMWMAPAETAAQLGIARVGNLGLASIRADLGGFFAGGGLFAVAAAIRGRGGPLVVPVVLIGLALTGRVFTAVTSGFGNEMGPPMAIEAALLLIFAAGWRLLPK